MKVLLSWIREFAPTELGAEEMADLLTAKGAGVEAVLRPWAGLSGVTVARVVEVADHPGAEKLCLARLDTGAGERRVVVGVRNMVPGDLVPYAPPGARLPALSEPLAVKEVRGEASEGMLCSPWELGISADHASILVLPPGAPLGADVASELGLDDVVLDIEVTPNRPDLLSVVGVAREVAAATGVPFIPPDISVPEGDEPAEAVASIEVLDPERSPRYLARVIRGISVGSSPIRVQARLTAMGMRPISDVVDATNYVMLELGQPMHPFDLDLLEDRAIVVRRAAPGERIVTLDDVERIMTADDLLIADRAKAVGIAGVIGSAAAEVHPGTSDVLLESAHFQAAGVLRTARRLRLRTEASIRFERGIDPEGPPRAADRCSRLIAEWTGGTVSKGPIDIGDPPMRRRVTVRPGRASAVLGYEVSAPDVQEALGQLGVGVEPDDDGRLVAEVPGYRVDLEQEVDLIEEVVRVQGYDRVGETLPAIRQPGGLAPEHAFRRRVRGSLVRAGIREVKTLPFASAGDLELMGHREQAAVRVANPLDAEAAFLRTSMVPALVATLRRNLARQVRGAAIFEVGNVFWTGETDRPVDEHEYVALAMTGPVPGRWYEPERAGDVFDAKGAVEGLLADLGIDDWSVGDAPRHPMHPGRSATVLVGGETAGSVGELHPRVSAAMDLPDRVAVAELDVSVLAHHASDSVQYREIPRFPPVHRDLAFVVDADVPSATLRSALIQAAGDAGLRASVSLFDVFTGPPVPEGRKSLAFSVDFRAPDRTLTDEEADRAVEAIRDRLARDVGAELRAG